MKVILLAVMCGKEKKMKKKMKTVPNIFRCCFVEKFIVRGKTIRMERAFCQLTIEHNSVVTSFAIHSSFFSASFNLNCMFCVRKKSVLFR